MLKIKAIAGYTLAMLAVPVVLATFIGMPFFAKNLVSSTELKVSPWYTGGEVAKTIDHGSYQTLIHSPVFDGLICDRHNGFVQLNWTPLESLPAKIVEDIQIDGGTQSKFHIEVDTAANTALISDQDEHVGKVESVTRLKKSLAVRVSLNK